MFKFLVVASEYIGVFFLEYTTLFSNIWYYSHSIVPMGFGVRS